MKVNATFVHPDHIFAFSQGSYQTLPNRNVLVGYGYSGAMTEFAPDGTVLCDAYLQPSSRFSSGEVQSYRNLKFNWTGVPLSTPEMVLEGDVLYVSWLGSTEVRRWALQDSFFENGPFGPVVFADKTGFETQLPLPLHLPLRQNLRVVALDENSNELAATESLNIGDKASRWPTENDFEAHESGIDLAVQDGDIDAVEHGLDDTEALLGLISFVVVCAAVGLWVYRSRGNAFIWPKASRSRHCTYLTDQGVQATFWQRLRIPRFVTRWTSPQDSAGYDLLATDRHNGE